MSIATANGDSLRIGGFSINLNTNAVTTRGISMTTEAWLPWLTIADDHHRAAKAARDTLLKVTDTSDFTAKMNAVEAEMQAAMVAISASSFALDAFYARIKDMAPPPQNMVDAWNKNKTARHKQISQVLLRNFSYPPDAQKELMQNTKSLDELRGWLVHPPAGFRPVQPHPVLKESFEWRKTVFTVETSYNAHNFVLAVIKLSVENPKPAHKALREWSVSAKRLLEPLLKANTPAKK